uniref:PID domain-containing protein n=1 Tax=Anopheles epiroticus TaxID=199890 RepID=A0A182PBI5_9DIPT
MYCTNDNGSKQAPTPPLLPNTISQFHPHELLYGCERDSELGHYWDGAGSGAHQNTTPVSTVLHSPEPAMGEHEPKIRFQQRHQIQVGRSPVGSGGHNGSSDSTTASSPVLMPPCHHGVQKHQQQQQQHVYGTQSILSDGEIVVFDDIEPNWPTTGVTSSMNGSDLSILMGGGGGDGTAPSKETHTDSCTKIQTIIANEMNAFQIDTKYYNRQQQQDALEEDFTMSAGNAARKQHSFALSPEMDYRSGCGAEFERAKKASTGVKGDAKEILNEPCVEYEEMCNSMPILEDGLSSGHASDSEGNTVTNSCDVGDRNGALEMQQQQYHHHEPCDGGGQNGAGLNDSLANDIRDALNDIKSTLQNTKTLPTVDSERRENHCGEQVRGEPFPPYGDVSPVWVLRTVDGSPERENPANALQSDQRHGHNPTLDLEEETDTDLETDRLLGHQQHSVGEASYYDHSEIESKGRHKTREGLLDPAVLIEGVLFRARYLGSTQLVCEGQPTKSTRMMQAEEAVSRIKAPAGESQPSTEVDLFISTEKIMVLNTDLKEIMMDHALRTISYIADIGQLVVLMARRRFMASTAAGPGGGTGAGQVTDPTDEKAASTAQQQETAGPPADSPKKRPGNRTPKMICHVFESEEAQFIAQSIGQAFQVAYMEFLKANGIEDHSFMKELDYQEVLNSQEIFV